MTTPLAGIKVIEIGQAYAGPLAGAILSDMGAEVIKVEKPDGGDDARMWGPPFIDGDSAMFHANNRNKKSVTLDIKNAVDVAALKVLVKDADILIQNLRPGIVEDFGIGPEAMLQINPRDRCVGGLAAAPCNRQGLRDRHIAVRNGRELGVGGAEQLSHNRQFAGAPRYRQ